MSNYIIIEESPFMTRKNIRNLENMYFEDSPIVVEWNLFGVQQVLEQNVIKNNKQYLKRTLIFGARTGGLKCITHLIHEMAHLVEIDDARILERDWGLKVPTTYIPGRYARFYPEPLTTKGTEREIRVIAYQLNVQKDLCLHENVVDYAKVLRFMPDFYLTPGNKEEIKIEWAKNKIEEARKIFTLERFKIEWKRKNELLKEKQYLKK